VDKEDVMIRTISMAVFIAIFLAPSLPSSAQEIRCNRTEQVGCIEIDLLIVKYDPQVSELHALVSGEKDGADVAMALYRKVKSGDVQLYEGCIPVTVIFWGINTSIGQSRMATYNSAIQPGPVTAQALSTLSTPESILGEPQQAFVVNVCGGIGALQVPWDYITSKTYALVCPYDHATQYPNRQKGSTDGLHLTTAWWRHASNEWKPDSGPTYEFVVLPIVM